tara:strand:+ start:1867 stop:2007 length:141 start_codon:yes stop_codon:yes gene_type:complete
MAVTALSSQMGMVQVCTGQRPISTARLVWCRARVYPVVMLSQSETA